MSRYPGAEWVPWKYRSPDGVPTYYEKANKPLAVVLHIAEGWQRTARQWANEGHNRASRHFSVGRDGSVMQHLELWDGGYHAGITIDQGLSTPPIWHLWKGPRVNVNLYTIGIEHEGFHNEPWPEPQRQASRELCDWLATALSIPRPRDDAMVAGALGPGDRYLLHYVPHAAIDRLNRVNDFAPIAARAAYYEWLKAQGGGMSSTEHDEIMKLLFGDTWATRVSELKLKGIAPLESRVSRFESNEGPIGTRLAALEATDGLPEHQHSLPSLNSTGGIKR